jgi:hypothetical protein
VPDHRKENAMATAIDGTAAELARAKLLATARAVDGVVGGFRAAPDPAH